MRSEAEREERAGGEERGGPGVGPREKKLSG